MPPAVSVPCSNLEGYTHQRQHSPTYLVVLVKDGVHALTTLLFSST